jgi:hypothetical protein
MQLVPIVIDVVRSNIVARCTTLCDKVYLGTRLSSTNETDRHDITEILVKVALNIINLTLALLPSNNVFLIKKNINKKTKKHKL